MIGRVIFSSGGNYRVLTKEGIFAAKPIGIFRKDGTKILVGDSVDLEVNQSKEGLEEINVIRKLYKRKNEFERPNISNIDNAILVTSINEPKLNDYYLDKLITIFQSKNIVPILFFTKKDLGFNDENEKLIQEYISAGFKTFITDKTMSNEQVDLLKNLTYKKFSVITGQTGVGKTTLLNILDSNLSLKTAEISKSLGRGKHTTRHTEVFEIFPESYLIDTPGFSSLEIKDLEQKVVSWNFFNFEKYAGKCKYNDCIHQNESKCFVKESISSKRVWKNYNKLLKEINENSKRNEW